MWSLDRRGTRELTDDPSSLRSLHLKLPHRLLGDEESSSNVDSHNRVEGRNRKILDNDIGRSDTSVLFNPNAKERSTTATHGGLKEGESSR